MVKLPRPYSLEKATPRNTALLQGFIESAGSSLDSFRYFKNRSFDVLNAHVCTLLICKGDKPLAYGHLDKEKKTVWLGIAVAESARGKGLGTLMMQQLMKAAKENDVERIRLSVDHVNKAAIGLYKRFGFKTIEEKETLRFMEKDMNALTVAVSTVAFCKRSFEEGLALAEEMELFYEFSSGMPFQEDLVARFRNSELRRMPHNYFPPPQDPFVLNLASANEEIRRRSIDHCKRNIELCKYAQSPFYAAHAGFCLDPDPSMLGQKITAKMKHPKTEHWRLFLASVNEILEHAESFRMPFLIENNVIIKANLLADGTNPLLCCEHEEIHRLLKTFEHPLLGILLDTAHLKVSVQTLGLDLKKEADLIVPIVTAVHHSDNDGTVDNNQPMPNDYWFLPFMRPLKEKVHVVEVKDISPETVKQQIALLNTSVN